MFLYWYTNCRLFEILQSTTELLPINAFYNDLAEVPCSEKTFAKVQDAWRVITFCTLEDYFLYYFPAVVAAFAVPVPMCWKTRQCMGSLNAAYEAACLLSISTKPRQTLATSACKNKFKLKYLFFFTTTNDKMIKARSQDVCRFSYIVVCSTFLTVAPCSFRNKEK